MNVADIKRRVANMLGDDAKVVFEDVDLIDMLNDAVTDIARRTGCVSSQLYQDVVANTDQVDVPPYAVEVKRVTFKGTRLARTTWQELDMIDPGRDTTTGVPTHFYVDGDKIGLYPTPNTFTASGLKIFYSYVPTFVTLDTETPDIPLAFHEDIVTRMIVRGHELLEDFQAAQAKATEYQNSMTLTQQQLMDGTEESYSYIRDTEGPYF